MTPLRQRMLDCMLQRGFAQRTQASYAEAISRMARHYRRDPAQLTPEEVGAYLLHLVKERHLSFSTVNQDASACRFLYEARAKPQQRGHAPAHGARAAETAAPALARGNIAPPLLLRAPGLPHGPENHVRLGPARL